MTTIDDIDNCGGKREIECNEDENSDFSKQIKILLNK